MRVGKQCSKCGELKPTSDFYRDKRRSEDSLSGYHSACKRCILDDQQHAYDTDPETFRARKRDYYSKHREERITYAKQYEQLNREKVRHMHATRKHGAENVLADLVARQDGACYLCGRTLIMPVPGRGPTHHTATVDHDHHCAVGHAEDQTCEICRRGAACSRCNMLISFGEEDPDLLRRIAANLAQQIPITRKRIISYVAPVCFCEHCGDEITYSGKGMWPRKFCSRKCMERKRNLTRRPFMEAQAVLSQ